MKVVRFVKDYPLPFFGKNGWKAGDEVTLNNQRADFITKRQFDLDLFFETGEKRFVPVWAEVVKDLGNFHGKSKEPCYVCCRRPEN